MVHTPENPKVDAPSVYSVALVTSFKSFCSSKYLKTKYYPSNLHISIRCNTVVSKDKAKLKNISGISDYHELGDFSGNNFNDQNTITLHESIQQCKSSDTTSNTSKGSLDVANTGWNDECTSTPSEQEFKSISLDCYDLNEHKDALMVEVECESKIACKSSNQIHSNDISGFPSHGLSDIENDYSNDEDVSMICE